MLVGRRIVSALLLSSAILRRSEVRTTVSSSSPALFLKSRITPARIRIRAIIFYCCMDIPQQETEMDINLVLLILKLRY